MNLDLDLLPPERVELMRKLEAAINSPIASSN